MASVGVEPAVPASVEGGDGQLFTRGGPNMPDTRGQSMVAKHIEKQQKEKEHKAMEKLKLLLPQLGPAVRAMALQECDWSEEKAVVMLRRFQVAKVEELTKLQKERKKHQLGLDQGKPKRDKEEAGGKRGKKHAASDSGSDDASSGSDDSSGSESGSGSDSEEERRSKRRSSKRKRSRSRSPKPSKRSSKDKKRRKEKDGDKRRNGKDRKKEKEKDRRRKDKDKARAKDRTKGAIGQEYGKYGIIRETDMYAKRPEFQLWAMEVKKVDLETMPRQEEKEMFKDYMEEYNTATLPHRKYYDLELYEKQRAAKAARKGLPAAPTERTVFDDETERKRELLLERQRQQQERMQQAYDELKHTSKARDMREQELLRAQMQLAYRTGDAKKAEQIKARLEPDDPMAPTAHGVRAPASGT